MASILDNEAVGVVNPEGRGPVVLVCEHASHLIPPRYLGLGLAEVDRLSHAAWDPGALAVSKLLSDALDAPLVAGKVSRLVYDCNRPPQAESACPAQVERITVPGNRNLSPRAKAERVEAIYHPFTAALEAVLEARAAQGPLLVTMHSFTPVFHGAQRDVEIGILHDADARAADHMLSYRGAIGTRVIRRNAPYGPQDGVTHTLKRHGLARDLPNVMVEIRNDLITDPASERQMAHEIYALLIAALTGLGLMGGHANA